jgi:hypothetical protein
MNNDNQQPEQEYQGITKQAEVTEVTQGVVDKKLSELPNVLEGEAGFAEITYTEPTPVTNQQIAQAATGENVPAEVPTQSVCQACKPEPGKTINLTENNKCAVCGRPVYIPHPVSPTVIGSEYTCVICTKRYKVIRNAECLVLHQYGACCHANDEPISQNQQPVDNRQADGKFGPGNNANPKGRPKRDWTWKEVLEDIASLYIKKKDGTISKKTYKEALATRLFTLGIGGNVQAIDILMKRMDGMPQQEIKADVNNTGSVQVYMPKKNEE